MRQGLLSFGGGFALHPENYAKCQLRTGKIGFNAFLHERRVPGFEQESHS